MKKKILFMLFLGYIFAFKAQTKKDLLHFFTFSEVEKLHQKNPKPIVVFIYTDWCKICQGMKHTTLKNKEVIQLLNKEFYFVQLNAEDKKDITFLGKTFVYKPTGTATGVHELANELASINRKISYPTTTILNIKFEIELQFVGLISLKKMKDILFQYQKETHY